MKPLYILFLISIFSNTLFGQFEYFINFDIPIYPNNIIVIDTVSNPNNIWQIGVPQKPEFDSAHSFTNAILTDKINPYGVNDTSIFILKHTVLDQFVYEAVWLEFWYKMNTDTLSDYGLVEVSMDNGTSWINLLTEDTIYNLMWCDIKPVFSGNSNGWKRFALDFRELNNCIGGDFDTLLFKFTFISDSIQTNKDGWMIDDFHLFVYENLNVNIYDELRNNNHIKFYPNPVTNSLTIKSSINISGSSYLIFNILGMKIEEGILTSEFENTINVEKLTQGTYILEILSNENQKETIKFVK